MEKLYLVTCSQTYRVIATSPEAARMSARSGEYAGPAGTGQRLGMTNTTTEANLEEMA